MLKKKPSDSMSEMKKRVIHGTAGAFAVRGLAAIAVLAMNILLARLLSVQEYGVIALGMSWLMIAGTIACFGTDTVTLRFVAEGLKKETYSQVYNVIRWGRRTSILAGISVAILSVFLIEILFNKYDDIEIGALWIIVASTPLFAFAMTSSGVLKGAKRVVLSASIEVLIRPLAILLLIYVTQYLLGVSINVTNAALIVLASITINSMIGLLTTNYIMGKKRELTTSSDSNKFFKIAVPVAAMNGMGVVISNLDTIVIGVFVDANSAGIYRASSQLATLVAFGLMASNGIIAPLIAELFSTNKLSELRRILRYSVTIISAVSVIGVILMAALGVHFLGIFGKQYEAGYDVLLILLIGQTINALCGPTGFMMTMTGHQHQAMWIFAISTIMNILLNITLVPQFGLIGGAVANVIGLSFWNLAILIYLRSKLNIDPSILSWLPLKV